MKAYILSFLSIATLPIAGFAASQEGTPVYYQNQARNGASDANSNYYQSRGYTSYVGQSNQKQVVNSRNYSYQVPRAEMPTSTGTMTVNGVALSSDDRPEWELTAAYGRRFADFEFKTGVNSILEWDDMIFNEISLKAQHNFSVRDYDLFAFGEYTTGTMAGGGKSMDYDLEPYDYAEPTVGTFTVSVGDQSGSTKDFRIGFGVKNVWNLGGWKLSPSIGYEIFHHDLQMSNHIYPNPATYLPLLTDAGEYVYGDESGYFYTVPISEVGSDGIDTIDGAEVYQVCMSPQDIKLADSSSISDGVSTSITTGDYVYSGTDADLVPWGVYADECVIIGGDGMNMVEGTTHIYNTTWSGFYIGLEMEKQMTLVDNLRMYVQFSMPNYSSEGTWPNRDDWQQNPSFIDEGNNGAYSYKAEMEYTNKLSDRLQLSLKVDTSYFYVGNIGGELYVASYSYYLMDETGTQYYDGDDVEPGIQPVLATQPAYTEQITDSLDHAVWQSFGLHLGLKYSF